METIKVPNGRWLHKHKGLNLKRRVCEGHKREPRCNSSDTEKQKLKSEGKENGFEL